MSEPRRPRPTPGGSGRTPGAGAYPRATGPVTRIEVQPSRLLASAGTALVTAARVGALVTRTGWRIASRLPVTGGLLTGIEREARRVLAPDEPARVRPMTDYSRRPDLEHDTGHAPAGDPLRAAMAELLDRSVIASHDDSQEYLFDTIVGQLVPDEARILAALADGAAVAAGDVVERRRRTPDRVLLANASAVGHRAGLVSPESTPTYLTRLHALGLVEFGPGDDGLQVQYDILGAEPAVRAAREGGTRREGSRHLVRKTVRLAPLGTRFWAAADPSIDPAVMAGRPMLPPA